MLSVDIQDLSKEGIYKPTQMDKLPKELNEIKHKLDTYKAATSDINLPLTMPKYMLKFECISTSRTEVLQPSNHPKPVKKNPPKPSGSSTAPQPFGEQRGSASPSEITSIQHDSSEPTSYVVDRMASDGINIMYTSIGDDGPDLIEE
jgi:hypothetical protein